MAFLIHQLLHLTCLTWFLVSPETKVALTKELVYAQSMLKSYPNQAQGRVLTSHFPHPAKVRVQWAEKFHMPKHAQNERRLLSPFFFFFFFFLYIFLFLFYFLLLPAAVPFWPACPLYALYNILCTLYFMLYTLSAWCASPCSALCTLYFILYSLYSLLTTLTRIDGIFHAYCITFVLRVHFKQLREDLEKGRKRSSTTSILMDTHRGLYPIHPFMIFFLLLLTLLSEDKQRQISPHYLVFCQQIWNPLPYPLME